MERKIPIHAKPKQEVTACEWPEGWERGNKREGRKCQMPGRWEERDPGRRRKWETFSFFSAFSGYMTWVALSLAVKEAEMYEPHKAILKIKQGPTIWTISLYELTHDDWFSSSLSEVFSLRIINHIREQKAGALCVQVTVEYRWESLIIFSKFLSEGKFVHRPWGLGEQKGKL